MIGTALWIALTALAVGLEVVARTTRSLETAARATARMASTRTGRAALYALWAVIGLHLFARDSFVH